MYYVIVVHRVIALTATTVSEKATRMMSSNPPLILNFMCLASYDGPTEVVSHEKWNIKFEKS